MNKYERLKLLSEKVLYYKKNKLHENHIEAIRKFQRSILNESV